ncbi:unnamed protein product [Neospora caninum Liverpool]|nr:uncharacterized protein NCLIV_044665 [Neospora caninum Liverpool]CBZ51405.1 unnamed protein product [Neospora caninum Liverpool]|eukprot:XP_003881438.1 uncharacterized protein NCLIV_044665 [Neospora caninum Liverpool]
MLLALGWICAFFGAKTLFGCGPLWVQLEGVFLFLVSVHHLTEFFFVFVYHRQDLDSDSFLLNNTVAYTLALVLSVAELRLRVPFLRAVWTAETGPDAKHEALLTLAEEMPVNVLRGVLASSSLLLRRCLSWVGGLDSGGELWKGEDPSGTWRSSPADPLASFSGSLATASRDSFSLASASSPAQETKGAGGVCRRDIVLFTSARGTGNGVGGLLCSLLCLLGLVLAVAGLLLRLCAFAAAGRNFTHQIARTRLPSHALVTRGVYGVYRHPAYTGWFYWAVGCQLALGNVICMLLFATLSFAFFFERIVYEEKLLEAMFPGAYCAYQEAVPRLGYAHGSCGESAEAKNRKGGEERDWWRTCAGRSR